MRTRPIGQSGIEASVVGLGTWAIGGWRWGGTDEKDSITAIEKAIDAGFTLIDTAPAYGMGYSEEIVGKAIKGKRDKVVLATKCGMVWHTDKGTPFIEQEGKMIHKYLGADSIRHEVEQSLKRLQTDVIDLYQTHWQDPTTPIEESMGTLLDLKKEGKIRAIGASNIQKSELEQYLKLGPVDSVQEKFSMLDRGVEEELLPFCRKNKISMLSYSTLALGLLSGKITPDREFKGDDLRKGHPRFTTENILKVNAMLEPMKPIADHYGISLAQLVTAWSIQQPGVTYALVGARNPQQAEENAKAGEIVLTDDEVISINKIVEEHLPHIT